MSGDRSPGTVPVCASIMDRVVHRASAALPDAGAWTNTALAIIPRGLTSASFVCKYTRGAIGGYPKFQVWFGDGTNEWPAPASERNAVVSAGIATLTVDDSCIDVPALHPTLGDPVTREIRVNVPPGVTRVALRACEVGAVADPGTLEITLVGGSGGIDDEPIGRANSAGAQSVVETSVETITVDLSSASPVAAGGAEGANSWTAGDLSNCRNFAIEADLVGTDGDGASGGTIDVYLQCSSDTTTGMDGLWTDWIHFAQVASGAAVVAYRAVPALTNEIKTVGHGALPALAAGAMAGGHPGKAVRAYIVSGVGASNAVTQAIKLVCQRPKA